jgi:hypothetical protein
MTAGAPVAVRRYGWIPGAPPRDLVLGAPQTGGTYARALVLLERDGVPWGVVGVAASEGIVRGASVERAAAVQVAGEPWASATRPGAATEAIPLRVVITSRQDSWRVVRAVTALIRDPDPHLEVVVVEHRDATSDLRRVLAETFPDEPRLTWCDAPSPGRARLRNRGAEGAADGLIAFLDDDVVAHPYWVAALRDAMRDAAGADIGVALGHTLPLALETEAQWLWFRASASGRGPETSGGVDRPASWDPGVAHARRAPGDGGICLSAAAFLALGGFDGRLGVGTPSKGGDDVDMVLRAQRAGYAVCDVPRAIVWREYPDALPGVGRDAYARGVGVSATMTKQLVAGPGGVGRIHGASAALRLGHRGRLRAVPDAAPESRAPRKLIVLERLGLVVGPVGYARSALRGRGAAT